MIGTRRESTRVIGTPRYKHWTPSGYYLEKAFIYLLPSQWIQLYAAARVLGLSPSQYLALLLDEDQAEKNKKALS